jgi:hypothetical protein
MTSRFQIVNLSFVDGQNSSISFTGAILAGGTQITPISNRKYIYSGLTNVSLVTDANGGHYRFSVTLKITSASELNSVASGVVTLPADVGAGYTVTLQESSDLSIWNAVFPGSFTGEATPKFFRVLLKKPAARWLLENDALKLFAPLRYHLPEFQRSLFQPDQEQDLPCALDLR